MCASGTIPDVHGRNLQNDRKTVRETRIGRLKKKREEIVERKNVLQIVRMQNVRSVPQLRENIRTYERRVAIK